MAYYNFQFNGVMTLGTYAIIFVADITDLGNYTYLNYSQTDGGDTYKFYIYPNYSYDTTVIQEFLYNETYPTGVQRSFHRYYRSGESFGEGTFRHHDEVYGGGDEDNKSLVIYENFSYPPGDPPSNWVYIDGYEGDEENYPAGIEGTHWVKTTGVTDIITKKRIVITSCDNSISYGDLNVAENTLVKLDASDGDIDTSDQCNTFALYQKVFVVNGTNLKVVDFVNYKLTHTALTTAHAKGDTLTQATTNATMVVDFTNTAKTATYGYVTSGTFNATNEVTGDGDGTAFTPSAVTDNDPPHWYDWTVYPGGSFGTMPSQAYLGCAWRGSAFLAGNPEEPEQWYKSKEGDPWDWQYYDNTALSAISGGEGPMGQAGDIIRALIPYQDDYIVLGCANSMSFIAGNPNDGGELGELDLTRGIFGAKSWCFDGEGNLYFWSPSDGLCVSKARLQPVISLSATALPKVSIDEALNPATHRICLGFDRERRGIIVTITTLASGENSNYFYSLDVEGFFPFSLPEECGAYSLIYYPTNDATIKGLLYGCKDGYVRVLDPDAKSDDIGGSDEVISATVTYPIIKMSEDDKEGILRGIIFETSGGASGGSYDDTDSLTYSVYVGDDAETIAEDIRDGATPYATGTITGTGRKTKVRCRARGAYLGLVISNSTADSTFGINRILLDVKEGGKVR